MDAKYQFSETYDNNGKLISGVSIDTVNNKYPYDINTYMSQPEYPGGVTRFREFIARNYRYPTEALKQNLSGRIQASFVVNSKGEITKIKIDKDLGYGTGQEAINLLKTSKKWKPGIMRGVPVNVSYTIPITINTRTM
jgi:hypothetical protein